jgi:phosphatidylinositol glycan class N
MSIFDIYFRSPLVSDLNLVPAINPAPATRLVLFVGDGLRADKCFEHDPVTGNPRAPFLRKMAREEGIWGISHTRVPTESRPGHVAMIAGFYEDVSAVTKGWKHNAVEFDHVLRRAKWAWSLGAPEIVDLFRGERVVTAYYDEEMIDFAKDAIELDRWSFDRLKELFHGAEEDTELNGKLRSEQVVIFVHLLGLDTNGHAFRPHSREYHENVAFVDAGVKEAVAMIDKFYGDDKTAYIFTSDHGMSDAGTHGDGDPNNTRCPLVAWGAGLAKPMELYELSSAGDDARRWKLEDRYRRDVNQADLTPLMTTLLGIPIPANSEGVLPTHLLGGDLKFRIRAAINNLRQLWTTLKAKEGIRAKQEPFFQPFNPNADQLNDKITQLEEMKKGVNYGTMMEEIGDVRADIFMGLQYYQKYDWRLLRSVVAVGFVGWMGYAVLYLFKLHFSGLSPAKNTNFPWTRSIFTTISVISTWYLYAKQAPVQYYFYFGFALYFWYVISVDLLSHSHVLRELGPQVKTPAIVLFILAMELMVASFFNRLVLSVLTPILAVGVVALLEGRKAISKVALWIAFAAASVFPSMEPIKFADPVLLFSGVMLIGVFGFVCLISGSGDGRPGKTLIQLGAIALSALLVYDADRRFAAKLGLPVVNQVIGWMLLMYSLVTPFLNSATPIAPFERLKDVFLTFAPAYTILSISYETLFYVCFLAPLLLWVGMQHSTKGYHSSLDPVLLLFLATKLLAYILLAFFGTGNFASISSFALPSVYRLVTVFAPFLMAALLIGKLLIPMFVMAASVNAVIRLLHVPPTAVFLLVVATVDVMTLNFFFLVKDQGSWLDIGTSISHFVIASVFSVVTLLVFGVSQALLRNVDFKVAITPKKID